MFDMTNLLNSQSENMNKHLFRVFRYMMNKKQISFLDTDICVPINQKQANRAFLRGRKSVYENLPHPKVHYEGGHACFKISDVIALHLAQGRGVQFTETPTVEDDRTEVRIKTKIHGCEAMTELLAKMRTPDDVHKSTFFGYVTTWSDTFLRSYVKQKLNNVWMFTITLPDARANKSSIFHTYCIAVGSGYLDHTKIID